MSEADTKIAALQAERAAQDVKVQQLRAVKDVEQSTLKAEIGKLKKLEAQLAQLGLGGGAGKAGGSSKQEVKFTLKTPRVLVIGSPLRCRCVRRSFRPLKRCSRLTER